MMSAFKSEEEFEAYLAQQCANEARENETPEPRRALHVFEQLNGVFAYAVPVLLLLGIGLAYWSFTGKVGNAISNPKKVFLKATGNENMEARIQSQLNRTKADYGQSMRESAKVRKQIYGK